MYAVFEKTLLTDKGKALVRSYQHTFDAQSIYRELSSYAMHSTRAAIQASSLLSHITNVTLGDGTWKGTTHAFILHWQDQVRKYHDMNPKNLISSDLQCTMLQNAVHPIMELRQVKLNAQQLKTFTGKDLSYDEYCSLLLSAAQQYDNQMKGGNKIAKRRVYEHDIYQHHMDDQDNWYDASFDIDLPLADLQINATNIPYGPRLSREQWHALSDDAKKIWDTLSVEAKTIILRPFLIQKAPKPPYFGNRKPPPRQQQPPPPCGTINEHDLSYLTSCLHELHGGDPPSEEFFDSSSDPPDGVTSVHEDNPEPNSQPLLAHVTKKKPFPPGNIKRLLSPAANSQQNKGNSEQPQELNVNGVIYRQVNMVFMTYRVSST